MKIDIFKEMREAQIRATIFRNSLTETDKIQIKQAVLRYYKFQRSVTWKSQTENTIYLLERNISPELLPKRKGIKFIIVTQEKIDEIKETGIEYYEFEEIDVLRTSATSFEAGKYKAILNRKFIGLLPKHNNLKKEGNGSFAAYRCEKISNEWRIKKFGYRCWTQVSNPNLTALIEKKDKLRNQNLYKFIS